MFLVDTKPGLAIRPMKDGTKVNDTQLVINSEAELAAKLPLSVLSKLHASLTGKAPVRFATKEDGARRLWAMLTKPNSTSEDTVAKKTKSTKSSKKTTTPAKAKAKAKTDGVSSVTGKLDRAHFLVVIEKENPRRSGTAGADNWRKYKTGQTLQEAIDKGIGMNHLRWDLAHGFVRLQASKPSAS